jgi:hypothetical protein
MIRTPRNFDTVFAELDGDRRAASSCAGESYFVRRDQGARSAEAAIAALGKLVKRSRAAE